MSFPDEFSMLHSIVSYQRLNIGIGPEEYLTITLGNILAEYHAFVREGKANQSLRIKGLRSPENHNDFILLNYSKGTKDAGKGDNADVMDLLFHVLLYNGYGFFVKPTGNMIVMQRHFLWPNSSLRPPYFPRELYFSDLFYESDVIEVLDMGYVGDIINEFRSCAQLLEMHRVSRVGSKVLLTSISHPRMRSAVLYICRELNNKIPINTVQLKALRGLKYDVEGIQGPPGTGKSTTIYHLVNSFLPENETILVTCVQNKAVGAIAEKLISAGNINFFVIGNENRLDLVSKDWTLEAQVNRHPDIILISNQIRLLRLNITSANLNLHLVSSEENHTSLTQLQSHIADLELLVQEKIKEGEALSRNVKQSIISSTRVLLCTVATASSKLSVTDTGELTSLASSLTSAVLDEAGTSSESKLPLLMCLPNLSRIIAIGDEKQLPPFTSIPSTRTDICFTFNNTGSCPKLDRCKFRHERLGPGNMGSVVPEGFFQRLVRALPPGSIPCLTEQFRMHPRISQYISSSFYRNRLTTAPAVVTARLGADPVGMWWIQYDDRCAEASQGTSKVNSQEVQAVLNVINCPSLRGKSVMIITFYKAQECLIRETLTANGIIESTDLSTGIRILSVDAAQGSEADVVILSCVRSNAQKDLGFVANENRLNVAVSRARERLVVCGDHVVLSNHPRWRALFNCCRKLSVPRIPPPLRTATPAEMSPLSPHDALDTVPVPPTVARRQADGGGKLPPPLVPNTTTVARTVRDSAAHRPLHEQIGSSLDSARAAPWEGGRNRRGRGRSDGRRFSTGAREGAVVMDADGGTGSKSRHRGGGGSARQL